MPIKFLKFSRRKSVVNSLDAGYLPANTGGSPSRPDFEDYSQNTGGGVNPYGGANGQQYNPNINKRGSGSGSGYSGGYYGSGSSNRLSSSSTLPSTDLPQTPASIDDYYTPRRSVGGSGQSTYMEQKPKATYGGRSQFTPGQMALEPPRLETTLDSTSFEDMFSTFDVKPTSIEVLSPTAPKLATTVLPSNSESSGIGYNQPGSPTSMKQPARVELQNLNSPPRSYNPAVVAPRVGINVRAKVQTFNTYSSQNMYSTEASGGAERWAGRPSEEGLISPTSEEDAPKPVSPRQSRNLTHSTHVSHAPAHARKDSLTAPPRTTRPPRTNTGDGLKRSSAVIKRQSTYTDDEDTALVVNHAQRSPPLVGPRGLTDRMKDRDSGWEETVVSGSSSVNSTRDTASSSSSRETGRSSVTSPRSPITRKNVDDNFKNSSTIKLISSADSERPVVQLRDGDDVGFDSSVSAAAAIAARYDGDAKKASGAPKKVMTKAQFERYRQQQDEERRLRGGKSKSDTESDEESVEDYDSDTERKKEVIRQRAKQEAHLSVYRQQMMKISGTTGTEVLNERETPMPPPHNSMPQLSLSGPDPGSDEDEEVPLGILMAHGFPSKNRPPTRLSNSSSQPNLRGLAQQQGQGGRLPVFARNLPADPYNYGAGLVNQTNRMPIGMGGGITGLGGGLGHSSGGSVYGGSVYGGGSEVGRHPGGLIGEIALAEEMKAARRHSPGGGYSRPRTAGSRSPGHGGMLGLGGGLPAGMSPGSMTPMGTPMGMQAPLVQPVQMQMQQPAQMQMQQPAQMQMQQQMQQMMQMQMQMQWMQQMQAQQQMQTQQQVMQGGLSPGVMNLSRPNSVAVSHDPTMYQRTMSMVDPVFPNFNPQPRGPGYAPSIAPSMGVKASLMGGPLPGYTPSIAPSERSTVGLPSRYRAVTQTQPENRSRASTMTSTISPNWQQQKTMGGSGLKTAITKDDDDDDDSAWEEMKKQKEVKRDGWKKRKALQGMLPFGSGAGSAATVTSS